MIRLDSSTEPVTLHDGGRPWGTWIGAGFVAALALMVPLSLLWHPVRWWGWVGMVLTLGIAVSIVWFTEPPSSARLVGDDLEVTRDGTTRTIPASDIAGVLTLADEPSPTLQLVSGEQLTLKLPGLWKGTAYPTVRVLSNWVVEHGGGSGNGLDPAVELSGPPRQDSPARYDHWRRRISGHWFGIVASWVFMWFALVLVMSSLGNDRWPDFSQGWAIFGAMGGVLWRRSHPTPKDWTKNRSPW